MPQFDDTLAPVETVAELPASYTPDARRSLHRRDAHPPSTPV
ncbi:hypothetical protein [Micromonospora sp. NPDC005710]